MNNQAFIEDTESAKKRIVGDVISTFSFYKKIKKSLTHNKGASEYTLKNRLKKMRIEWEECQKSMPPSYTFSEFVKHEIDFNELSIKEAYEKGNRRRMHTCEEYKKVLLKLLDELKTKELSDKPVVVQPKANDDTSYLEEKIEIQPDLSSLHREHMLEQYIQDESMRIGKNGGLNVDKRAYIAMGFIDEMCKLGNLDFSDSELRYFQVLFGRTTISQITGKKGGYYKRINKDLELGKINRDNYTTGRELNNFSDRNEALAKVLIKMLRNCRKIQTELKKI